MSALTRNDARLVVTRRPGVEPRIYAVLSSEQLAADPYALKRCVERADRLFRERGPDAPEVSVMTWDEFETQGRMMADSVLEEITREQFYEALEVLPPFRWHTKEGVERFFLGEATKGTWAQQYARRGDRYVTKLADFADPSTWIAVEEV